MSRAMILHYEQLYIPTRASTQPIFRNLATAELSTASGIALSLALSLALLLALPLVLPLALQDIAHAVSVLAQWLTCLETQQSVAHLAI